MLSPKAARRARRRPSRRGRGRRRAAVARRRDVDAAAAPGGATIQMETARHSTVGQFRPPRGDCSVQAITGARARRTRPVLRLGRGARRAGGAPPSPAARAGAASPSCVCRRALRSGRSAAPARRGPAALWVTRRTLIEVEAGGAPHFKTARRRGRAAGKTNEAPRGHAVPGHAPRAHGEARQGPDVTQARRDEARGVGAPRPRFKTPALAGGRGRGRCDKKARAAPQGGVGDGCWPASTACGRRGRPSRGCGATRASTRWSSWLSPPPRNDSCGRALEAARHEARAAGRLAPCYDGSTRSGRAAFIELWRRGQEDGGGSC